ncbi:efflux RND transporter permease subunit [Candidatus Nanosyncoccus alces]|uniref:Membrane protein YdfJ n=1 Tax=Candidatus Nanosyncoccus alces TaxID=2171997 RepID=A0ABY0FLT8_9BACT|nr:MMPL family transporter [Candidatus Nanosyncoccus alces]RYC74791.1 Membrane protein YdfJ [Candidatus Nanosyncoccus alces]
MGKFVVKYRKFILALAVILIIPALIGMFNTRVNYDMLNYLPDSMETVIGQEKLMDEFGKGAFSMIITEGLTNSKEANLETAIKNVNHVDTVLGLGTIENAGLPAEFLPDNIYNTFHKDDESLVAVFFDTSSSAEETIAAIKDIRTIVDDKAYVSGMSAFTTDLRELSGNEELFYIIIAVTLALIVMLLLLDNWLAPVLFLVSIGVMILYNLGTNLFLGEISYITKALSAILQLAVTMDYSIFLWHSYREHLATTNNPDHAMANAIKATLSSVFGSSATTVAGFIALCFMTFTLGLDLGIVMAKGVILGVLGSVTVLPALILTFDKTLRHLDHKSILPDFTKLSNKIVKFFPVFLILFVAIIPPFLYGYQKTNENVYYTISDSLPSDMPFAIANQKLSENFGLQNVHMILSDANLDTNSAIQMTNELKNIAGVKSVLNLESVIGDQIPAEILPSELTDILKSENYKLTLVISEYQTATPEIAEQIQSINQTIKTYDEDALLVGESSLTQDMINLTSVDFQVVNTISIIAIFIIIAIVTRSISLPFILIAVIESAIFINLGLCYFTGTELSFITPICISTIQLGATVDYAILMTTRYNRERLAGRNKREAAKISIKTSLPSIIVSGAVLFAATIGVAVYSQADMISSMCMLMARGAIISIFVVPTFLPSLLILADPLIIRTTLGMKKLTKGSTK